MLIVFLPIFVANTKIIFGCNFAAPFRNANKEGEF